MGQKRIRENLYKRYGKEEAEKRITEYKARVERNLARESIYLLLIQENKVKREIAYINRNKVKNGVPYNTPDGRVIMVKYESCKQRKRRLRKEYLAKKKSK